MTENKHIKFIDYMRVFATICVIMSHIITNTYSYNKIEHTYIYIIFDIILNYSLVAVPIFLMITGYLLLDDRKKITLKKCFKYIYRVLIVLLFFGTIFNCVETIFDTKSFSFENFMIAFKDVCVGKTWNHMWYIYMLMCMYMILPFFRIIAANIDKHTYFVFLTVIWIINFALSSVPALDWIHDYFPIYGVYIFYLFAGDYIRKYSFEIDLSLIRKILFVLVFIASILHNFKALEDLQVCLAYNGVFSSLFAICLFEYFTKKINKNNVVSKVICVMSDNSFGIYIMHMIFVNFIIKFLRINFYSYENFSFIIFVFEIIIVMLCSLTVSMIMKKIPYLKKFM